MTKQEQYLKRTLVYMKMLDHAFTELNKVWAEDSDHDVDLNEYLVPLFPFHESFDQMQLLVREWVRSFANPLLDEEYKGTQELDVVTKLRRDFANAATENRFYVLYVRGDVEPSLVGPFDSQAARDAKALELKYKEGDEHGLYKLWWKGHTHLSIGAFTGFELDVDKVDGDGELCNFVNHYECTCGTEWIDRWSCACDDECPNCGKSISPDESHEADKP